MLNSRATTFTGLPFKTSLTAAIIVSLCIATRSIFRVCARLEYGHFFTVTLIAMETAKINSSNLFQYLNQSK